MARLTRAIALFVSAAFLFGALAACGGNDARFTAVRSLLANPVSVGQRLLLVDRTGSSAILVDATSADPRPLRAAVLPDPTLVVGRVAHGDQALVLSAGVSGDRNALQAPGGLTLVSADGSAKLFALGNNPFDFLTQQPAGRYVALLRSGTSDQLLQNANEMGLVDLEASDAGDATNAARLVTLPEAPRAVFFSEGFTLEGKDVPLAVAVTDNMAAVFDLTKPQALPVLIQLNTDTSNPLHPQDVRFDPPNARFYIRSSGTDDIFSLRLVPRASADDRASFGISIDIVAAGERPTDMQVFELDGNNRLLVIAQGNSTAVLVDVTTSRTTSVRLPEDFDHGLVYYTGEIPGARSPHALLWNERSGALLTLSLDFSSTVLEQGLTELPRLPSGARQVVPFADGTVAFIGFSQHITLVDPVSGRVTPYNSQEGISDALLDEARALLWLAPRGQARVAYLDLVTGGTDEMLLDQDVRMATLIPDAARMAVIHDDPIGHITFINLDDPRRGTSVGVRGFLVEGLFE